jgi:hypothetical protein
MLKIGHYDRTEISLQLEEFYNAGLTSKEAKDIIEKISLYNLYCQPAGLNGNWTITINSRSDQAIDDIIRTISYALHLALQKKGLIKDVPVREICGYNN